MLALDLRTIFLVAAAVNIVLCIALAVYWRTQKTYPGFGVWVLANTALAIVYILYMLRGLAPDFWTILIANTLAAGAAALRLDGTRRFLEQPRFSRSGPLLVGIAFCLIGYFTYVQDDAAARITSLAVVIAILVSHAAWLLTSNHEKETRRLYWSVAALLYLQGAILVIRAIVWVLWPENRNLFAATPINVIYFFAQMLFEIVLTIAYVTMTSQRLTLELSAAQRRQAASEAAERQQRTLAEALVDSASALNSTLDQDQVLARILENVGHVVSHDAAAVMLLDSAQNLISVARSSAYQPVGVEAEPRQNARHMDIGKMPHLTRAAATHEPVIIPDVTAEAGWLATPASQWVRANLTAPILLKGEVVGFLTLNSATVAYFDDDDARRLCAFADQAAIAIGNARLYAAEQRHADELEQSNRELDAYAHTVAHDLKNPLGIMVGAAEMLHEEVLEGGSEDAEQLLSTVIESGYKMNSIIQELLALAATRKAGEIEMEVLDMAAIVDEAQRRLSSMIDERNAVIEVPASWPDALGHAPWVEEVWVNLLGNAIKYGVVTPHIRLGAEPADRGQVAFWIRDNGFGIPPAEQNRLFGAFERLPQTDHIEGTGLGLSIVKRIVERLGGRVGVESSGIPGEGSLFCFTLPAV